MRTESDMNMIENTLVALVSFVCIVFFLTAVLTTAVLTGGSGVGIAVAGFSSIIACAVFLHFFYKFFGKWFFKAEDLRNEYCVALRELGIVAHIALGRRVEEEISGSKSSIGIIDVQGSIGWINIIVYTMGSASPDEGGAEFLVEEFGVPDSRVTGDCPNVAIKSVRKRTIPILGKVIEVEWKGDDYGLGVRSSLEGNGAIRDLVVARGDHDVTAHSDHGCWLIRTERRLSRQFVPPLLADWRGYEAIAQGLLAAPISRTSVT